MPGMNYQESVQLDLEKIRESVRLGPDRASASTTELTMSLSTKTVMDRVNDDEYLAQDGTLSMKREYGQTPNGNPMSGRWVLRDSGSALLDFDQYVNDLAERRSLELF